MMNCTLFTAFLMLSVSLAAPVRVLPTAGGNPLPGKLLQNCSGGDTYCRSKFGANSSCPVRNEAVCEGSDTACSCDMLKLPELMSVYKIHSQLQFGDRMDPFNTTVWFDGPKQIRLTIAPRIVDEIGNYSEWILARGDLNTTFFVSSRLTAGACVTRPFTLMPPFETGTIMGQHSPILEEGWHRIPGTNTWTASDWRENVYQTTFAQYNGTSVEQRGKWYPIESWRDGWRTTQDWDQDAGDFDSSVFNVPAHCKWL